jgi:hypothetical protein
MGLSGQHFPGKKLTPLRRSSLTIFFSAGIGHVNGGFSHWEHPGAVYFTGELLYIFVYQG